MAKDLAVIRYISYICTVKIIERLKDVAETSGIFLCRKVKYKRPQPRGTLETAQGIAR